MSNNPIRGCVYLLWAETTHLFKIGFTKGSVDNRALQIQTACPFPLRIAASMAGTTEDESGLHRMVRQFRTSGEWFCLPEQPLRDVLAKMGHILGP